jgi:hypothetical protein
VICSIIEKNRGVKKQLNPSLRTGWSRDVLEERNFCMVNSSLVLPESASPTSLSLGNQSIRKVVWWLWQMALQFSPLHLISNCISQNSLQFKLLKPRKGRGTNFISDYLWFSCLPKGKNSSSSISVCRERRDLLPLLRHSFKHKCLEGGVSWRLQ